jgi:hypothetical protein
MRDLNKTIEFAPHVPAIIEFINTINGKKYRSSIVS